MYDFDYYTDDDLERLLTTNKAYLKKCISNANDTEKRIEATYAEIKKRAKKELFNN